MLSYQSNAKSLVRMFYCRSHPILTARFLQTLILVRSSRARGTESLRYINPDKRYALVVLLAVLAGGVTFLFVIEQPPGQEQEFSQHAARGDCSISPVGSDVIDAALVGLEVCNSYRVVAVLSNDQDHDGNIDSMPDPLAVLLCGLVVLCPSLTLLTSLRSRLLLRLQEPPNLVGSGYYLALERPG